jgi:hypothetical protein
VPTHAVELLRGEEIAEDTRSFYFELRHLKPPKGSFNEEAVERGKAVARCSTCHVSPLFTEPGWNMHLASEIGVDDFQANWSPDKRYRTSPLKGLWTHQKGGF